MQEEGEGKGRRKPVNAIDLVANKIREETLSEPRARSIQGENQKKNGRIKRRNWLRGRKGEEKKKKISSILKKKNKLKKKTNIPKPTIYYELEFSA